MIYPSIRIEGAILSADLLDQLEDKTGQNPKDFGLGSNVRVKDEIARTFAEAQSLWKMFQRKLETLPRNSVGTSETRNAFIGPLLSLLGFNLEYQNTGPIVNGKTYAISHMAPEQGNTRIHIMGYLEPSGLDKKPENQTLRMSAHAIVQEYLNLTEDLYAIVTNGRVLRVLRDSTRLVKQSYIEFDFDRMFTDGLYADFAVFYRLVHATRFPKVSTDTANCILEKYHQDSLEAGDRIRDGLSIAVIRAINAIGSGFVTHPSNEELRRAICAGEVPSQEYYKWLLRIVYRLLFLMVVEERDLLFPQSVPAEKRKVYDEFYSLSRLRKLSEKAHLTDKRNNDLWTSLCATFSLFGSEGLGTKIGIEPLGGDLFQSDAIGLLSKSILRNDTLLQALFDIGFYENATTKTKVRVNYAALNVEEFGSVYEGLLELDVALVCSDTSVNFLLKKSDARANTGSHYTPDELVQPLIKHSLDHLIEDRIKRPNAEEALLDLKVADIACGSGHILLAAARRIATELATVRTGEDQPSPTAYRSALRDVIRHCIYGVDLNPLAVELCKVAFWLEAHNPGEPLNFLDHHIKCGNAIVGFRTIEEVKNGIPSEAFTTLPGDDKDLAADYRKRNTAQRKNREQLILSDDESLVAKLDDVVERQRQIVSMPEDSPAAIALKQQTYKTFSESEEMAQLRRVASLPVAMFYTPRTAEYSDALVTDDMFISYWNGKPVRGSVLNNVENLAERKRFFHWFIEFPEIADRGGFDCILGNPPYLGQALSGTYGHDFCNYVKHAFNPTGLSDLVVYFARQLFMAVRQNGYASFITTNSIKDGDVRRDGLEQICNQGGVINFALRNVRWPGRANVYVSLVGLYNGKYTRPLILDNTAVDNISPMLESEATIADPTNLRSNQESIFVGSMILGDGFFLSHKDAKELLSVNPDEHEVIRTVINGQELNNDPEQLPRRSIINFRDMSEDEARRFPEVFRIVETLVKPVREQDNMKSRRERWWQFGTLSRGLNSRINESDFCFVAAATTKYLNFSAMPTDIVFTHALYVLPTDRWDLYGVVQSTIHEVWARKYSGALKQDLRYSPSDCFKNFAFPGDVWTKTYSNLERRGATYHQYRKQLMLHLWLGLTDLYNHFHYVDVEASIKTLLNNRARRDPKGENIPEEHRQAALSYTYEAAIEDIKTLRQLHVDLDNAVRDAYGWQDLDLGHNFHDVDTLPETDRTRYTISPEARKELLKRLLKLNHERATEEAASGAAKKPAPKPKASNPAQTGMSFRSVADTPKPKLASPILQASATEPKPSQTPPPPPVHQGPLTISQLKAGLPIDSFEFSCGGRIWLASRTRAEHIHQGDWVTFVDLSKSEASREVGFGEVTRVIITGSMDGSDSTRRTWIVDAGGRKQMYVIDDGDKCRTEIALLMEKK